MLSAEYLTYEHVFRPCPKHGVANRLTLRPLLCCSYYIPSMMLASHHTLIPYVLLEVFNELIVQCEAVEVICFSTVTRYQKKADVI